MLKMIATLFLLSAAIVSTPQVQPSRTPTKGNVAKDAGAQKTAEPQKQPSVEPQTILCNGCAIEGIQQEKDTRNSYNPSTDTLYRAYLWAAIIAVLIALGGISAVYQQTKHLGSQTYFLQQQIDIQKRSSRQWVTIGNWRQDLNNIPIEVFELSFDITNPTPIPLRLDLVTSKINGDFKDEPLTTFLIPQNPYSCNFTVTLNEPQITLYRTKGLGSNAEISVYFTDAFDNQWCQTLQCLLFIVELEEKIMTSEYRTTMRRSSPDKPEED